MQATSFAVFEWLLFESKFVCGLVLWMGRPAFSDGVASGQPMFIHNDKTARGLSGEVSYADYAFGSNTSYMLGGHPRFLS